MLITLIWPDLWSQKNKKNFIKNMHLGGRAEQNTAVEAQCINLTYVCKKEMLRRCLLSDSPMALAQH